MAKPLTLFFYWGIVSALGAPAAPGSPRELLTLAKSQKADVFLTGSKKMVDGKPLFVAVTKINPADPPTVKPLDRDFFSQANRPRTWDEAKRICTGLGWLNAKWRLPDYQNAVSLVPNLMRGKTTEFEQFRSGLKSEQEGEQFAYFWIDGTRPGDKKMADGIKLTMFAGDEKGASVYQTRQKPINFFCVADFSEKDFGLLPPDNHT